MSVRSFQAAAARGGPSGRRRAVFLDKDGTLVEDVPYNVDPELIRLCTGAQSGLGRLSAAGFLLIAVSNQPGVALGFFEEEKLKGVYDTLSKLVGGCGAALCDFYYCPHAPLPPGVTYPSACDCRKPAPGLLQRAAVEHGLDLEDSWMIGDILDDVEAGRRAGCRTVLIDNGNETEWRLSPMRLPHYFASDLDEAARLVQEAEAALPFSEERR